MKKLILIVSLLLSFVGLSQEVEEKIAITSVDIYHPQTHKLLAVAKSPQEFIKKADSLRVTLKLYGFILITNYADGFSKSCKFGQGIEPKNSLHRL